MRQSSLINISCVKEYSFYTCFFFPSCFLLGAIEGNELLADKKITTNMFQFISYTTFFASLCTFTVCLFLLHLRCFSKKPRTELWESRNLCSAVECKVIPSSSCRSVMLIWKKNFLYNYSHGLFHSFVLHLRAFMAGPSIAVSGTQPWCVFMWINRKYIIVFLEKLGNERLL